MNLIPWRQKKENGNTGRSMMPFEQLRFEMDNVFDQFFRGWDSNNWMQGWSPAVDVSETDQAVNVRVEVPGVDPKELDISVSGDMLTVAGEKKEQSEKEEGGVHRKESFYGSFRRNIPLPAAVDPEKVTAEHAHGVVSISLAKAPNAQSRKIAVKAK
jgi:HSP20 family protein